MSGLNDSFETSQSSGTTISNGAWTPTGSRTFNSTVLTAGISGGELSSGFLFSQVKLEYSGFISDFSNIISITIFPSVLTPGTIVFVTVLLIDTNDLTSAFTLPMAISGIGITFIPQLFIRGNAFDYTKIKKIDVSFSAATGAMVISKIESISAGGSGGSGGIGQLTNNCGY